MVDLMDVAPVAREVTTHKYGKLSVYGLSFEGIISLLKNNPKLLELVQQSQSGISITPIMIMGLGEDIVAAFVATGLGYPGEQKALDICKKMNPDDMLTIITAILEETIPGGIENFSERIGRIAKSINLNKASKQVQRLKTDLVLGQKKEKPEEEKVAKAS